MIIEIFAIIATTMFQCLYLGNFELIANCALPWIPYALDGTNDGIYENQACLIKCKGKAFHTNEGKLICFYKKDTAQKIPNRPFESSRNNKSPIIERCNCGYRLSSNGNKWMSCNFSIPDTTKKLCNGICDGFSVYLFKRHLRKQIIYCERYKRQEFYEMDGQVGDVLRHTHNSNSKYRICSCGISNTHLKYDVQHPNVSSDDELLFEKCAKPWKETKFTDITKVETCSSRCHKRCKQAYGVYYKGKSLCFHQSVTLVRRSIIQGGSVGICECGHGKRTHKKNIDGKLHREFSSCEPPIVTNEKIRLTACKEYCSRMKAYVYRNGMGPWNIQCMSEDDHKSLKPELLSGRCDPDVHREENHEGAYMICHCGLLQKRKSEIPCNRTKVDDMGIIIKLPDLWSVKKKRSKRIYQKTHIGGKK